MMIFYLAIVTNKHGTMARITWSWAEITTGDMHWERERERERVGAYLLRRQRYSLIWFNIYWKKNLGNEPLQYRDVTDYTFNAILHPQLRLHIFVLYGQYCASICNSSVMSSAKNCVKTFMISLLTVDLTLLRCSWSVSMGKIHTRVDSILTLIFTTQ